MIRTTLVIMLAATVLYVLFNPREGFMDVLFTSDNVSLDIVALNGVYDASVARLPSELDGKILFSRESVGKPSNTILLDSIAFTNSTDTELLAVTDDECKACFIKGFFSRIGGSNVKDLQGHHVGYVQDKHLEIARIILRSCDVDTRCIGFKKLTYRQASEELRKPVKVDAILYFGNSRDPLLSNIQNEKVVVMNLHKYDKEIAAIVMKTMRVREYDVRLTFQNAIVLGQPVQTMVYFPNVLYTTDKIFTYLHTLVIQRFAENSELDYLSNIFNISERARSTPRRSLELYMDADSMQMTFMPTMNIQGYFDSRTNTFEYDGDTLEGTPLHEGDNVVLNYQNNHHEEGQYIVKAIINGRTMMKLMQSKADRRDESKDDSFYCVTNPRIKYKQECTDKGHVWDAPCLISQECPFFQSQDESYRGGCKSGYCEMPVGAELVGFKHYYGKPFCKDCPRDMLACCDHKKHPKYEFAAEDQSSALIQASLLSSSKTSGSMTASSLSP
jgi:hypothetical protein